MKAFRYILFAPMVWLAIALGANAQGAQCGGYADVLADLSQAYHEQIVWVGERGAAGQLVITAKPDGSTWTAMLVRGGGGLPGLGWDRLESDRQRRGDLT